MPALACGLALLAAAVPARAQEQVVAARGSAMRYLANTSDPEIVDLEWIEPEFDDSTWTDGAYGVGYEESSGAEALIETEVPEGTLSVYTRVTFDVEDAEAVTSLRLGADYDDGYVVWINGTEIFRSPEMPSDPPEWDTVAALHESSNGFEPDYGPIVDLSTAGIPELVDGENLLAVGVWNGPAPSSDLVLVPRLVIDEALSLVRGPYLQMGSSSEITVRWRTDAPQTSRVVYGTAPDDLGGVVVEPVETTTEHEITVSGLMPDTRYYYGVGSAGALLVGGDERHTFVTAPATGASRATRIWVIGDSGFGGATAREVRDAYLDFTGATHTDLWLMLGDNAYLDGTDQEYQENLFDVFDALLRKTVLWPTLGNHDALSANSSNLTGPYYDIFTLPAAGEAGGVPSGSEAYYSFDYGNVHFVVLDSADSNRTAGSAQLTWLEQDVNATAQEWLVAFWHHAPYSRGSHDSDVETAMIQMRENALPILEDAGVDLVLTGHSHSYERSFLIDGHYGGSATFGSGNVIDGGNGLEVGDGAYQKSETGLVPHQGTVYAVAGNGSEVHGGPLDHPAMYVSLDVLGSMVVDVDGDRLDATMLGHTGSVLDRFTMVKGPYCPPGTDDDGDVVCNEVDNCPDDPNPGQEDGDGDGIGDACDDCPADPDDDADADGVCGDVDNCPDDFNPCQIDNDDDGAGDACDASSPESCNVFVDEDSWLEESNANGNHGQDDVLRCRERALIVIGEERPVLHFDLSTIPAGSAVTSATAWFFVTSAASPPVDVHRVTDDWTESTVTWSDTASDFDPAAQATFAPSTADEFVSVDLTAVAQAWMDGTQANQGVMLIGTGVQESRIAGSEYEPASERPCMHVVFQCLTPGTDADGDGVPDIEDGCPNDPEKTEPGVCGCGRTEDDSDGDGTLDCEDGCPADPGKIDPGACGCGNPDTDTDADGTADCVDPCPLDPDDDADGDGTCGDVDNCPATPNTAQADDDEDGAGDFCDPCPFDADDDGDGDGACAGEDNCPGTANPSQADADGDGLGDACDACPLDADDDYDGDTVCGDVDNCPGTPNPSQTNSDDDPFGDACDSPDDADGDGVADGADNCVADSNPVQRDLDGDGAGDACDDDDDGDGVEDTGDCARLVPGVSAQPGPVATDLTVDRLNGGSVLGWRRGIQGHVSNVYRGAVGRGQGWNADLTCVDVANPGTESAQPDVPLPGALFCFLVGAANTCGESHLGWDGEGIPRASSPGCATASRESDGDGVKDAGDNCPLFSNASQSDADGDFVGDPCDNCPAVFNPDQADADGDGTGDACE